MSHAPPPPNRSVVLSWRATMGMGGRGLGIGSGMPLRGLGLWGRVSKVGVIRSWWISLLLRAPGASFCIRNQPPCSLGVKKDEAAAVVFYRSAAEDGHVESQYKLGIMMER